MGIAQQKESYGDQMREKIYDIIETGEKHPRGNKIYSIAMLVIIVLSLVPLAFRTQTPVLIAIDKITVTVFIIDYALRFYTADLKYDQGSLSFVRYPFSLLAVIDLISILPSLTLINDAFKTFRVIRAGNLSQVFLFLRTAEGAKSLKATRALRTTRYSKSVGILYRVFSRSKGTLLFLLCSTLGYVATVALIIFNVEPETFHSYFDALYWAVVSLTTIGYGDIYAVSVAGKIVTMVSSFVGVAVIALPSGVITAGFMRELDREED